MSANIIEFATRNTKGQYSLQIRQDHWKFFEETLLTEDQLKVDLEGVGIWHLRRPTTSRYNGKVCIVVKGIEVGIEVEDVVDELWTTNESQWNLQGIQHEHFSDLKRLKRLDG